MSKQTDDERNVPSITDAREGHTDEMRGRIIRYSISMSIRLVCLVLIFFVHGWLQWACVAGAVCLPYIAVILANAGSDQSNLGHSEALLDHAPIAELEAPVSDIDDAGRTVVPGEVIDDTVLRLGTLDAGGASAAEAGAGGAAADGHGAGASGTGGAHDVGHNGAHDGRRAGGTAPAA